MKRPRNDTGSVIAPEDELIPHLCVQALKNAYRRALAENVRILVSGDRPDGGRAIFEVSADGTRRYVKDIDSPVSIPVGTRARIL